MTTTTVAEKRLIGMMREHNIGALEAAQRSLKESMEREHEPLSWMESIALAQAWAKDDADTVVRRGHARGRQARIRLNFIKGFRALSLEQKRSLYKFYTEKLNSEIAELDGGKSYGSFPSFD